MKNKEYIDSIQIITGIPSSDYLDDLTKRAEENSKNNPYHHTHYSGRHAWDDYMAPSLFCLIKQWQSEYSKKSGLDISESLLQSRLRTVMSLLERFASDKTTDDLPIKFIEVLEAINYESKQQKLISDRNSQNQSKLKLNTKRKNKTKRSTKPIPEDL